MTERILDLRVRAQLQGVKDLDEVAKSIGKIGTAIDGQTEAAKRGENRIDELKSSLEALTLIQKELAGQSSAIKYFQDLTKGLAGTEAKLASATKRYAEYNAKLEESGKSTKAQQETLIRYGVAVEKSAKALQNQKDRLAAMEVEFNKAGIAVDRLADVQARNQVVQEQQAMTMIRAKDAVKDYAVEVRKARDAQAVLDKANLESARTAKLFEEAERKATAASEARARAAREVAEAQQQRGQDAGNNRLIAEQEAQAKRAKELAALRADIFDRSDAADRLIKQTKDVTQGYTTLARAATDLNPKMTSFRDTVRDIIDPSRRATTTLASMEQQVAELAAGVIKINGPIKGYREQSEALAKAQGNIQGQAALIDSFNKQAIALRAARTEFVNNRAEVTRYALEVNKGGTEAQQFAAKLAAAEAKLKGSAQALAQQVQATRASRDSLRAAGIASNELAAAQTRLNAAATSTVGTLNRLQEGYNKYGAAVDKTRVSQGLFANEGRTTLSYVQRLRGEVLSLVAAYGGLYTVLNVAKGAVQATQAREGARNQLGISVGNDKKAIDAEYEYVKGQADRIGVEFERAIKGYTKFSAAATLAGRDRQEVRYIFETFTEVARVANLSADELDGVFKALEQITSKGKIQAEELRGQLGDRLFGAFEIAAKALKSQFPDLDKALKNGEVSAKQLVLIAEEYRKTVADQLPAATKSLAAQQARLNNELFDFKLAVADSGFIDSYSAALRELTKFLQSEDGKNFAATVGAAFKVLADVFVFLLKNIDEVVTVMQVMLGLFAVGRFIAVGKAIKTLYGDFLVLKGNIDKLTTSLGTLFTRFGLFGTVVKTVLGLATAAIVGWEIGTYLREKFQIVRDAGIYIATAAVKAMAILKASYQAAFDVIPEYAMRAFNKILTTIADAAKSITRIFAKLAGAAGFDELAGTLNRAADSMGVATRKEIDVLGTYRANLAKEMAGINAIRDDMLAEPMGGGAAAGKTSVTRPVAGATSKPAGGGGKTVKGPSEADIKKRENEIEGITRALEALDAKIDRSQTETLAKQLEAIDSQYAALSRRIEKLGGETGRVFMQRLTSTVNELKDVTIKKFNDDLQKEQDAFLKKTGDAEEQAGKRERLSLSYRLGAIVGDYAQMYKELEDLRVKFQLNKRDTTELDDAKRRLDISKAMRMEQETTKFNTEELNRREALMNDTIAARDKLVQAVNTQKEVGAINDIQAAEQINAIQDQYIEKINQAATETAFWALSHKEIFANPEQMAVFLATLEAVRAKANGVKIEFSNLENSIINGMTNAVNSGVNMMADALTNLASGTTTVGEGFQALLIGFAQFAAQFLRDIAIMIIKMAIFKAMQGSGNPYIAAAGTAGMASMGVKHSGGVIGGTNNRTRTIPWNGVAPRYHNGGVMGLASDEYATILQKGEEVLAANSPRNIMNGGSGFGNGGSGGGDAGTRIVLVDDRARVPEAMNSPDGERVIMTAIKANLATVKQWVR